MSGRPCTVRQAGPADAETVRRITRAAYAVWVPVLGREPRPMSFDQDAAIARDRVDLAVEGDAVLGVLHLILRDADVLIENLAVDPAHQGRGIADVLLDHAAEVAQARGAPVLRLYTNALMARNVAFYGRRGFLEERRDAGPLGTIVHMARTL